MAAVDRTWYYMTHGLHGNAADEQLSAERWSVHDYYFSWKFALSVAPSTEVTLTT